MESRGTWLSSCLANYREIQHAVLVHKVVGAVDVIRVLQATVIDAGVRQAAGQVGTRQRLVGHLRDGHLVAKLPHVLAEEIGVAHIEGGQGGVEGRHCDGGDLGPHCREERAACNSPPLQLRHGKLRLCSFEGRGQLLLRLLLPKDKPGS